MPKSEPPRNVSCHCGAIRFEVHGELTGLLECNCSTCRRHGFLHWKVPAESLRLTTERVRLSVYSWREISSGHHFCPVCGTPLLRTGYPDGIVSVNARCIDEIDTFTLDIGRFDGRTKMRPGILR